MIPGGYELWMSCVSRGIAVLTVPFQDVAVDQVSPAPSFALLQNAPNPFRASTTLRFSLPRAQQVRVSVFDVGGRLVRTLVDGQLASGRHEASWDGTDASNRPVASGAYFCKLSSSGEETSRRMILAR
jgi:hypothetical protein